MVNGILFRTLRHVRRARRVFLTFDPGGLRTPADFTRAAVDVVWMARFYYIFTTYSILRGLTFENAVSPALPTDPLWPVTALTHLAGAGWLDHATPITLAGLAVALLAMIFPGARLWRLLVFLYLFLVVAVQNSYGSINHGAYFYLFIGFALLFLPPRLMTSGTILRGTVVGCIHVLWFAQSVMLLSYTLAGWWKIQESGISIFEPGGMVRILLARLMEETAPVPPLLPLAVSWGILTQLMFLVIVYVQVFAILAVFRPHLHRPFGIVLVLFHIGSGLLLGIGFHTNVALLTLFLVFSPMAPTRFSLSGLLQSLPLLAARGRSLFAEPCCSGSFAMTD